MTLSFSKNLPKLPKVKMGFDSIAGFGIWLVVLFIVVWEVFVIRHSVAVILPDKSQTELPKVSSGVRIDFEAYQRAASRIGSAPTFVPDTIPAASPFKPASNKPNN